ncbi:BRO-N domain-containing protein [Dapis sp. BLCC M172]|uniref:BRO-N domain-containing protein n=1 Tax=Dapis sp. BLCC M172 TaxID=2975281 RepID=UPI003CE6E706
MLTYNFNSNKVRVIFGDDDEPYFVVEDICDILKVSDGRLSDEDKITHKLNDEQEIIVTSEFGLHELMMNSVGEKDFKRWVVREMLPAIRTVAQSKSVSSQELLYVLAIQKEINYREIDGKAYFTFNATAKLCGTGSWELKKDLTNEDKVYQLLGWYTQADLG